MKILVFDTETTGLPLGGKKIPVYKVDLFPYIVQISWATYDTCSTELNINDHIIKLPDDEDIPEDSIKIHGITNEKMRNVGGKDYMESICNALGKKHSDHIAGYGSANEQRFTGLHETQSIKKFTWGVSDRGASIRVPWQVAKDGYGYLEDRRPSSNCDPYLVSSKLIETICGG